jgi:hypothetical protein
MVVAELQRRGGACADSARRSPATQRRADVAAAGRGAAAPLLEASPRERRTLEDVLSGVWEELSAHRAATCPICSGAMEPRYGSGPFAVGGRCRDCQTEVS